MSTDEDREEEFAARVRELQEEFDDLNAPVRGELLTVMALSIVDGFCFAHTERRATEGEFLLLCRDVYRKARELVPLVKPAPPGQN